MYENLFLPTVPQLFKCTSENLHSKQQVITQFPIETLAKGYIILQEELNTFLKDISACKTRPNPSTYPYTQKDPDVSGQRGK